MDNRGVADRLQSAMQAMVPDGVWCTRLYLRGGVVAAWFQRDVPDAPVVRYVALATEIAFLQLSSDDEDAIFGQARTPVHQRPLGNGFMVRVRDEVKPRLAEVARRIDGPAPPSRLGGEVVWHSNDEVRNERLVCAYASDSDRFDPRWGPHMEADLRAMKAALQRADQGGPGEG